MLDGDLQLVRGGRAWVGGDARRMLDLMWLARDTLPAALETTSGAVVLELPFHALEEALEEHFSAWLATTRTLAGWLLDLRPAHYSPFERHALRRRPGLVEREAALEEALPFARGYVDALLQLDSEAEEVRFDRGAVIWRRGDAAHSLLVPLDGALRGVDGDVPVGLGGLELLAGRTRTTQLEATQPLTALLAAAVIPHAETARLPTPTAASPAANGR